MVVILCLNDVKWSSVRAASFDDAGSVGSKDDTETHFSAQEDWVKTSTSRISKMLDRWEEPVTQKDSSNGSMRQRN